MPLYRAIIGDDEPQARKGLTALLSTDPEIELVASATNGQEARQLIEQHHPQIALLDIHMPLLNGVELVEKLSYRNFQLVFITAYDRYALQAFEVRAIDYLLKPFDDEAFYTALDRAKQQVQMQDARSSRADTIFYACRYCPRVGVFEPNKHSRPGGAHGCGSARHSVD